MSNLEIRTEGYTAIQLAALMAIVGFIGGSAMGVVASFVDEKIHIINGVLWFGGVTSLLSATVAVCISASERMHEDTPKPTKPRKRQRKA